VVNCIAVPFHTLGKSFHYFFIHFSFVCFTVPMSKRANSSQNGPQAKRTRLPSGFRLARPPLSSQPASSSNSSLFITVNANSHRRGTLTGESHLIPSTLGISEQPLGMVSDPQPAESDDLEGHGEMPVPEIDATAKPKRKRHTTNSVRN
jgi:hypothetical protein